MPLSISKATVSSLISIIIKNYLMQKRIAIYFSIIAIFIISANFISCSKPSTPAPPVATCADKTIVINGSTTPTSGGTTTNGSITVSATGSTGFTYSVGSGAFQSSGSFTTLAAGTYTVTAKDDAGCTSTKSFVVAATACPTIVVTATVTNTSSPTSTNGAISASATGSTGLTYSKDGVNFQATGSFTALAVGSYTITVKDVNGCTGSAIFSVSSVACPTITISSTTTPTAGPTATNGSISATASGGVAPYTYSKDGTNFQASGTFSSLLAGNYTIVAKDANSCLGSSATITVASTPCPTITLSANVVASDKCLNNNGSITAIASGSTGYTYNLNGGTYQAGALFGSLATGSYTLGVKDANGCTTTSPVTVAVAVAGPNFSAVKALLATNCAFAGCHASPNPQGGVDLTVDCTIVAQSARIKARAVDANPSVMPPTGALSAADKLKITNWIAAGGQHSN
jgi:large repetitive protein